MYNKQSANKNKLHINNSYTGETIEAKIARIINNKEPIKDGAPIIYTDRKDGILPALDIRTDRFELAIEGMDHVAKTHLAKREEAGKAPTTETKTETGGQPTQTTETK